MSRTREGLERKRQGHLREGKQAARGVHVRKQLEARDRRVKSQKNLDHFSICACHPCAGAMLIMLIFSVSF